MKKMVYKDDDRFFIDPEGITFSENSEDDIEEPLSKQNASYQDFSTPSKLDSEVETILNSIKDDVMTSIKKTKYFTKKVKEPLDARSGDCVHSHF